MFTLQQIEEAHSTIKSGADFPTYIQDLKKLGVIKYQIFVHDNHAEYFGLDNYHIQSNPTQSKLEINTLVQKELFQERLRLHQEGQSDYITFCTDCAHTGIAYWTMDLEQMTCTYYGAGNEEVLVEKISFS